MGERPDVLVVGSGPAGLAAAWAVRHSGRTPVIMSPGQPSHIQGAQYLHKPIPGAMPERHFFIEYVRHGTEEGYARKIYGNDPPASSWGKFEEGLARAWSLKAVYNHMWKRFSEENRFTIGTMTGYGAVLSARNYEYIIWTAPLNDQFPGEFSSASIVVIESAPEHVGPNQIHYHGDRQAYYRCSDIDGVRWTEYPISCGKPPPNGRVIVKPLSAKLTVELPDNLILAGRYGRWEKGVLVDHVYSDILGRLDLDRMG